jgi:2'-5' RNA ligase
MTRPESIHLTLAFVGDIARDALPRLVQAGAATRGAAFELEFERAAFWRHNRIAYLKPATPPGALLDLVTNLEAALDAAGIGFDRRAYTPHLTLVRNAACGESRDMAIEPPIPWRADEFLLVESRRAPTGAGYAALARFKLS